MITRKQRRERSTEMGTTTAATTILWKEFQYQDHSLVINASDVSSCAGFHEFKNIPELLFNHVYQGFGGNMLLQHDATLLGLRLVSEDEEILQIAQTAGSATVKALNDALDVKSGKQKLQSIEGATQLRQKVIDHAKESNRLSKQQVAKLEEKTRYAIDTGCGTSWEDEALDRYEKMCRCCVQG